MYDVGYNRLLLSATCEDPSLASLVAGLTSRSPNKRTANAIAESSVYTYVRYIWNSDSITYKSNSFCSLFLIVTGTFFYFVFHFALGDSFSIKTRIIAPHHATAFFCAMDQRNVQTPFSSSASK